MTWIISRIARAGLRRAILGIGAGISGFSELGINRRKPARAIREMIQVICALLQGESVDFHGEVIELHQGSLGGRVGTRRGLHERETGELKRDTGAKNGRRV